jgi:protein ImuA
MDNSVLHNLASAGEITSGFPAIEPIDDLRLRKGRVHELTGASGDVMALLSAAKTDSDIIWIGMRRDILPLCASGLDRFICIHRIIVVEAVSRGELLWATDAALRAEGGFTVIADLPDALSLKESRRLQLAAEQGGGIGLLLLRGPSNTSAAQTRWQCEPLAGDEAAWRFDCQKGKSGEAGHWHIRETEVQYAKDNVHMAARASA